MVEIFADSRAQRGEFDLRRTGSRLHREFLSSFHERRFCPAFEPSESCYRVRPSPDRADEKVFQRADFTWIDRAVGSRHLHKEVPNAFARMSLAIPLIC